MLRVLLRVPSHPTNNEIVGAFGIGLDVVPTMLAALRRTNNNFIEDSHVLTEKTAYLAHVIAMFRWVDTFLTGYSVAASASRLLALR
jgi:hypothetical protein